jgi:outer membrane protein
VNGLGQKSLAKGVKMRAIKILFGVCILVMTFFMMATYAADVAKIGVVNMQRLLETSSAGKAVKAELTKIHEKMKTELQQKEQEYEMLIKQVEAGSLVLSREKREEREREARIKKNDLLLMKKRFNADLKRIQDDLMTKLLKDVFRIGNEIGKKEGYLLIVRKSSVFYAPTSIDITDQLIKEYNIKFARSPGQGKKKGKK